MRTLVGHLTTGRAAPRLLAQIVDRADGNPFFAEELTCCTLEAGLPVSLADLLLVRLDRLSAEEARVVRTAACAGRQVSHGLLAEVLGGDPEEIERSLRAAVEANVLVPVGEEYYAFRHALLAEAVYDDLLPGERVRIHSGYATALPQDGLAGTAAELAHHARLANDLPTALPGEHRGRRRGSVGRRPDEAARHYETALELLPTVQGGEDSVDAVALVASASDALALSGQGQRAVALVQSSLRDQGAEPTPTDLARLNVTMANAILLTDAPVDPVAFSSAAIDLLGGDETPLLAAAHAVQARGSPTSSGPRRPSGRRTRRSGWPGCSTCPGCTPTPAPPWSRWPST